MTCQSAPPGRTTPLSRGPATVPPVMAMTRRRPRWVDPSSSAGATATRSAKAKSRRGAADDGSLALSPAGDGASGRMNGRQDPGKGDAAATRQANGHGENATKNTTYSLRQAAHLA